jgi:hypothetical protein
MLQILSNADCQQAAFDTERTFRAEEIVYQQSTKDAYEDELTAQILFRALRDPGAPKEPLTKTVLELKQLLTREQKDALVLEYEAFEQECSPQLVKMTNQEFDELWEALKKSPESRLSFLNIGMQRRLLLYLASRPAISQTDSSST